MKRLILSFLIIFSFAGCEAGILQIPKNFPPKTIVSGGMGNLMKFELKVSPPQKLRYSGEIFLPTTKDSQLSFNLYVTISRNDDEIRIPDLVPILYIKDQNGQWEEYDFFTAYDENGVFYISQIVLPYESNQYKMRLMIKRRKDSKMALSLLELMRNTPLAGREYIREFDFDRSLLINN